MNIELLKREVRPVGGVFGFNETFPIKLPNLLYGDEKDILRMIMWGEYFAYGTVAVIKGLTSAGPTIKKVAECLADYDWRFWEPAGLEPGERCWVKSHYDGNTYGSHARYLEEAVKLTTGPVLELGCGEGSTPMLHEVVCSVGDERMLYSIDNNRDWLNKFSHLANNRHRFHALIDPAKFLPEQPSQPHWGVVFVDHAPGETRKAAIERARDKAEYIVVHDTEEFGYGVWDILESFKYKRHFRYMRPWTSVVSMTREIFADPYGVEK
ncbi:MAG: hypothetical protein V4550_18295 [Gemmatimonadota bacterium]